MAETRGAPQAEEVRGGQWLFVEGDRAKGRDQFVLGELFADLRPPLRIEPLGPSFHVESVAKALHPSHPRYCFLIDRDHRYDSNGGRDWDSAIEERWERFPDTAQSNLLIWRRRELENYFLIPDYLAESKYLSCAKPDLESRITEACGRRIYFDAANLVVSALREESKRNWIKHFKSPEGFGSADEALAKLLSRDEIKSRSAEVSEMLKPERIEEMLRGFVTKMLDGSGTPVIGRGQWLEMVRGSKVLPEIVDSCFRVANLQGKPLQGDEKLRAILKDLLTRDLSRQPEDFQELHRLMDKQTRQHT